MRKGFPIGVAVLFVWCWIESALAFESVYTMTRPDGPNCQLLPDGASWRCRGPAGYSALFSDGGNIVDVAYGPRDQERSLDGGLQWRGAEDPVGRAIEWRLSGGRPFAAILRINVLDKDEDPKQFLLVARVGAEGSCRIAMIDARQPNSNVRARQIADRAGPAFACRH
jgi:hypothetical protein